MRLQITKSISSCLSVILLSTNIANAARVKPISCDHVSGHLFTIDWKKGSIKAKDKPLSLNDRNIFLQFNNLSENLDTVFHIRFATTFEDKEFVHNRVKLFRNKPNSTCLEQAQKVDLKDSTRKAHPKRKSYNRFWQNVKNSAHLNSKNPSAWHFKYRSDDINNKCVDTRNTVERGKTVDFDETATKKHREKSTAKNYKKLNSEIKHIAKAQARGGVAIASTQIGKYIWLPKKHQFYSSILIDAESTNRSAAGFINQACYKIKTSSLLGRYMYTGDLKPVQTEFHFKKLPGSLNKQVVNYKRVFLNWK